MVGTDRIDEAVQEFKRLWLDASRQKLRHLCALWDPWINRMLTEPLARDWRSEVHDFVDQVRESVGLEVAAHSVRDIEALIRKRAGGTGVFTAAGPAPRQEPDSSVAEGPYLPRCYKSAHPEDIFAGFTAEVRSYSAPEYFTQRTTVSIIAADGSFVQRVIPNASGFGDLPVGADLVAPDGYRDRRGNLMQRANVLELRKGIVDGRRFVFFRRAAKGPWFSVAEKFTEIFSNGRSLGTKLDLRGANSPLKLCVSRRLA